MTRSAIVIGAGIIGMSVAWRLAQQGVHVEVLDGCGLATGTSGNSFAWLHRRPVLIDLAETELAAAHARLTAGAFAEHVALRHEFGGAPWLHQGGCLEWGEPPGALAEAVTADSHLLYPAEVARVEPWLQLPESIGQVSFFPSEGHVDVPLLVGRLALGLREAGVTIRDSAEVAELLVRDGTVQGVVTTSAQRLEADVVVSCAGPWTDKICQLAGVDLPLAPTQGMLTITRPSPVRLNTLVRDPVIHLRDDGSGRVIIGSYEFEAEVAQGQDTIPFPEAAYGMYEAAAKLLPGLHGTGIEAVRIGQRAIPADGYPVAGYAPGVQGLYVICTHGGIRLGPLLGRLAAREICAGTRDERLSLFTPDRLTPGVWERLTAGGPAQSPSRIIT